ncbi:MAG: 50S ribosomal protein L34 [Patescibacteria group bacterium]|nr:50S ribosomal protein L34 [Patescibacteria group bacterium]
MPKRTYQPKKRKTLRKLGYMARKSTPAGKRILKRRIKKGRKQVSVSDRYRVLRKKPKDRNR